MKLIVVEIVVGFGLPFAWGVWELVKLRREQRRDAEAAEAAAATSPGEPQTGPEAIGHDPGPR